MISRLTKIQLLAFLLVTLVGVSYVGARYAQVDRIFIDRTYQVTVDLPESGGIFAGAEVTYRGIAVGTVKELTFTDEGVRATLDIENSAPKIAADAEAVVANKSAIGEQYLDLRPQSSFGPYLKAGSKISVENARVPIDTTTLLTNLNAFVASVPTDDLRTVVTEFGTAFDGAGPALAEILDSTSILVDQAQANIDVTRSLIRSSATVLQTQVDKGSQIQSFAADLALFTDTLVSSDDDLRRLIDDGAPAAQTVNAVVSENSADLTAVLANLQSTVQVFDDNVLGLQALFLMYPMLVQGTYTATVPTPTGEFNAAFGMVTPPEMLLPGGTTLCDEGYREVREEYDISDYMRDADGNIVEAFTPGTGCATLTEEGKVKVPRSSANTDLSRTVVTPTDSKAVDLEWLLLGTTR